jgi:GT2 family glycosyltransferase
LFDEVIETAKISIVMTALNGLDHSKKALSSLLKAVKDSKHDFELFLTDDGSTDGSHEYFQDFSEECGFPCTVFQNARNRGVPYSMNVMMKACTGDFVLRIDNDIEFVSDKFMDRMVGAFESVPMLGAISCLTNKTSGPAGGRSLGNLGEGIIASMEVNGFCLMVPRDILEKVDYIDEDFPKIYGEDRHLVFKVAKQNYLTGVYFGAYCLHHHKATFGREGDAIMRVSNEVLARKMSE